MRSLMNTFIAALAGLCASRPLDEKRLVAPSRRVGNQWLDAAARAGRPMLNVRVETLRSLAVDLAAPALASGCLRKRTPRNVPTGRCARCSGRGSCPI